MGNHCPLKGYVNSQAFTINSVWIAGLRGSNLGPSEEKVHITYKARFNALRAVLMKIQVLWDIPSRLLVNSY